MIEAEVEATKSKQNNKKVKKKAYTKTTTKPQK